MGQTLLCVLGLFLLTTDLSCGHAEDDTVPDLKVSPTWLSPGASVTLHCSFNNSSAGWRFFWYKAIRTRSNNSYRFEPLPGTEDGTDEGSYTVQGQTHTAGFKCRAKGKDNVHTQYSRARFVWTGDFPSSVRVSPDKVQHFSSSPLSLSCEGEAADWTVRRFTEAGHLSKCSVWGTMNGSICNISKLPNNTAVYWCETSSGQFSNAVNITVQNEDVILESPVAPVTEGESVTLGCKLREGQISVRTPASAVFFYRNGELIQNDARRQLEIAAVSQADEGFYQCSHSGTRSPQSWMSVKLSRRDSPSVLLPLVAGSICGVLLIILLLLLCDYRKSKKAAESEDIIYSVIQIDDIGHKGKSAPAEMDKTTYSEVKVGAAQGL